MMNIIKATWNIILTILAVVAVACFSLPSWGATITASATSPTTNTDGTTIPVSGPGSLTGMRFEYGTCAGVAFGTAITEQVVATPGTTAAFLNVGPGTYCVRVFARNTYGSESASSAVVSKVVPAPTPNPPTVVTAVVAGINMSPAYRINIDGSRGTAVLGHVPVGVICDGPVVYSYRGRSYRRVTPDSVLWDNTTPTVNVAAPCVAV